MQGGHNHYILRLQLRVGRRSVSVSDVGAVVRPLNRPLLDHGRIDVGPLKRLNRPRPNGLQTVVVQGGVEIVRITLGNYHVEPQSRDYYIPCA